MISIKDDRIQGILNDLQFSDGSSLASKSSELVVKNSNIGFSVDITGLQPEEAERVRSNAKYKLESLEGVDKVSIVLTSNRAATTKDEKPKLHIDGVSKVILVAAGKGGVGKSTISALLAHKLKADGHKVGIIDADIYGPSIPHMFGLRGKPELDGNKMIPLQNYGISVNSIGFLTAPDASVSWRGPMTSKALYQLLSLTKWGNLDYLIIDTPPGTGDIHLSLLQNYIIDQVIMVTTPQKISELDVSRAINLYKKFNIPIAGVIENMSYYLDPDTNKKIKLFSGNSGQNLAKIHNIPMLAQVPISTGLSEACDKGTSLDGYLELLSITDNDLWFK